MSTKSTHSSWSIDTFVNTSNAKEEKKIVLEARIANEKLKREGKRTFNDLRESVTEVIRREISSQLNSNQIKQMYEVLNSYQNVFATNINMI